MEALRFRCRHCRRMRPVKKAGQAYCGERACQRARKQKWSRQKYAEDPDYKKNQKESTSAWLATQGGAAQYYRDYRRQRRERREEERRHSWEKEAHCVQAKSSGEAKVQVTASLFAEEISAVNTSANRDADTFKNSIKPGIYKIFPASANRDPITAEIRIISSG